MPQTRTAVAVHAVGRGSTPALAIPRNPSSRAGSSARGSAQTGRCPEPLPHRVSVGRPVGFYEHGGRIRSSIRCGRKVPVVSDLLLRIRNPACCCLGRKLHATASVVGSGASAEACVSPAESRSALRPAQTSESSGNLAGPRDRPSDSAPGGRSCFGSEDGARVSAASDGGAPLPDGGGRTLRGHCSVDRRCRGRL